MDIQLFVGRVVSGSALGANLSRPSTSSQSHLQEFSPGQDFNQENPVSWKNTSFFFQYETKERNAFCVLAVDLCPAG